MVVKRRDQNPLRPSCPCLRTLNRADENSAWLNMLPVPKSRRAADERSELVIRTVGERRVRKEELELRLIETESGAIAHGRRFVGVVSAISVFTASCYLCRFRPMRCPG